MGRLFSKGRIKPWRKRWPGPLRLLGFGLGSCWEGAITDVHAVARLCLSSSYGFTMGKVACLLPLLDLAQGFDELEMVAMSSSFTYFSTWLPRRFGALASSRGFPPESGHDGMNEVQQCGHKSHYLDTQQRDMQVSKTPICTVSGAVPCLRLVLCVVL